MRLSTRNAGAAPAIETQPALQPIPVETFPNNPNDPLGVRREIIEEIEKIGRKYARPFDPQE